MTDSAGGFAYQEEPEATEAQEPKADPAPRYATAQQRLDPAATEAVLRRAFELAHVEPARELVFSRSTLAEIAAEVDLPLHAVATALAEQLADGTDDASFLDRLIGPDRISVHRASTASEEEMRERALRLLEIGHGMRPRVQFDGVVVASKRKDVVGKLARSVRDAQGLGQLGKMRRIEVAAVDVGDEPGALVVSADIGDRRTGAIAGGAAVSAVGGAAVVGAVLLLGPLAWVAAPVAVGTGVVTSRVIHGSNVRDAEEDLHQAADALVNDREPESMIGRGAKKALESILRRNRKAG